MIRVLGTVFAALLGLAFGSFLNVCLSRWPEGESIVMPRSHCRKCGRVLAWWENVPLVSWIALRGRCRTCGAWIGWRYVIVEAAVSGCWTVIWIEYGAPVLDSGFLSPSFLLAGAQLALLSVLLVGLAVLDAEHFWLPDIVTFPSIAAGLAFSVLLEWVRPVFDEPRRPLHELWLGVIAAAASAGLILLIRWLYWLIRRREGLGLGDAKLMALLAAWLGFSGALLAFGIGVVLGALVALIVLLIPRHPLQQEKWAQLKLPLGTFLCIGGIVSALWGQRIIAAYLRWAGF
jgi:leader peptidase (prepilin peptidase) / N-methyltransferase